MTPASQGLHIKTKEIILVVLPQICTAEPMVGLNCHRSVSAIDLLLVLQVRSFSEEPIVLFDDIASHANPSRHSRLHSSPLGRSLVPLLCSLIWPTKSSFWGGRAPRKPQGPDRVPSVPNASTRRQRERPSGVQKDDEKRQKHDAPAGHCRSQKGLRARRQNR